MKKLKVNENYFDKIDTEAKAYFLGLLYADGCNEYERNLISISLQEKDKKILEIFKQEIEYEGNLLKKIRSNKNHQNSYILRFTNKHICNVLKNYGMVPRKSLVLLFPKNLSKNLIHHFIRGYFDGDGCISEGVKGRSMVSIVGTLDVCENIQKFLVENSELNFTKLEKHGYNTYKVRYGGHISCNRIFKILYKDATVFLERKYKKFKEVEKLRKKEYVNDNHYNSKRVIDINTKKIYNSIKEASILLNINYITLSKKIKNNSFNLKYYEQ